MSLQNAYDILGWMYRGSEYTLRVLIMDDDCKDYPLADTDMVLLRLADSSAHKTYLELEGNVLFDNDNKVEFVFMPEHTENLMAGAYDLTVIVFSPVGEPWPALHGRFGIAATSPEVS